jgi:hypothetical protein
MSAGLRDLKATAAVSFIPLWGAAIDLDQVKEFHLWAKKFFRPTNNVTGYTAELGREAK